MQKLEFNKNNEALSKYRNKIAQSKFQLFLIALFDLICAVILIILLSPIILILCIAITIDSPGGPFFLQERVGKNGKIFKIIKFRSMTKAKIQKHDAELITAENDQRITRMGHFMRKLRLDEIPQLINIIKGDMSFVGTRPEVPAMFKYYSDEMYATLLMKAGLCSKAALLYKDESEKIAELAELNPEKDRAQIYGEMILPEKMRYNLEYIMQFSLLENIKILWQTFKGVFIK